MAKIDKLIMQARIRVDQIKMGATQEYDFSILTIEELKELAYGEPTEKRFKELVDRMR